MHFITNGFKHFSKTNSTDPRQRVPLNSFMKLGPASMANSKLASLFCVSVGSEKSWFGLDVLNSVLGRMLDCWWWLSFINLFVDLKMT